MIRDLADFTLDGGLKALYDAIAAAVLAGAVVGVAIVLLSAAARGGD